MLRHIQAACGCHIGKLRKNNEDNYVFDGKCLSEDHNEPISTLSMDGFLRNGTQAAVFDGMGGENFGELASWAAAREMTGIKMRLADYLAPEKYVNELTQRLHRAVVAAQQQMHTEYMGTTMVSLHLIGSHAYVCNVGDSRGYCLRNKVLTQLSHDHVANRPLRPGRKAPLTQHLGYGGGEIQLEPHVKKIAIRQGDLYLLCSDGLTDLLHESEITDILCAGYSAVDCVDKLIQAAMEHGGRDNITVMIYRID